MKRLRLKLRGIFDPSEQAQVSKAFADYLDGLGSIPSPHLYRDAASAWFNKRGWEVHNTSVENWPGEPVFDILVRRCRPHLPCPKCNKLHNLPEGDYICDQCRAGMPS